MEPSASELDLTPSEDERGSGTGTGTGAIDNDNKRSLAAAKSLSALFDDGDADEEEEEDYGFVSGRMRGHDLRTSNRLRAGATLGERAVDEEVQEEGKEEKLAATSMQVDLPPISIPTSIQRARTLTRIPSHRIQVQAPVLDVHVVGPTVW